MKIYFRNSHIPELSGLSRQRRKLVYQCALEALLREQFWTMFICATEVIGCALVGLLAGGWLRGQGDFSHPDWFLIAGGLGGGLVGNFLGSQLLTARLRPYLRRVLTERRDEIDRIV